MRTYNTIEEMNAVAKQQWREYARENIDNIQILGQTVATDSDLAEYANMIISMADEDGDFWIDDGSGNGRPRFTMEMESWARGTTDGIEVEIEILEWNTQTIEQRAQEYEKSYLGELPEGYERELWETAEQILAWKQMEEDGEECDTENPIPDDILEWAREYKPAPVDITVPAMVEIFEKEFDLTTIATWMQESIPETLTKMQERVLGEITDDGYSDEQYSAFNKAFWEAIFNANK